MLDQDNEIICKVVLVGESGVGKTSINKRFIENTFSDSEIPSSSASFLIKEVEFDEYNDQKIKLKIWDTCGQEKYRSLGKIFYKGATAAILVYEIINENSFQELKKFWYPQIKEHASKDINKS